MTRAEIDTCEDEETLYERLGELADETGWIESRLWALGEDRGDKETRELRSDYYASR